MCTENPRTQESPIPLYNVLHPSEHKKEKLGTFPVYHSIDWARIKQRPGYCNKPRHRACKKPPSTPPVRNLRAIDSTTRQLVHCPDAAPYLTLSYVCGKGTRGPGKYDALPEHAPRVIEDAVSVTLDLGFRYLWVDRYCIRQNNPEEREQLVQLMGKFYAHSFLTIIAAAGEGPDHGLAGVSSHHGLMSDIIIGQVRIRIIPMNGRGSLNKSKWASRAWTFQEGLLAQRRLVFGPNSLLPMPNGSLRWT